MPYDEYNNFPLTGSYFTNNWSDSINGQKYNITFRYTNEIKEDKVVIKDGVIVSDKSIANGCKVLDKSFEIGDFVIPDDTYSVYNTPCVVTDVAKSFLCVYNFKKNCIKMVDITKFYIYEPNDNVKNIAITMANNSIENDTISELTDVLPILEKHPDIVHGIHIPVCDCCGKPVLEFIRYNDKKYCRSCFNKKYTSCVRCGDYTEIATSQQTRDGYYLCDKCGSYHYITSYHHHYPKVDFFGNNHKNNVPYLGFELEVDEGGESDYNCSKLMDKINKPNELFAYCSHDGSLIDGFEIITQPATVEYHNSIKDVYARSFDYLKKTGYMSHDTTTCGFHVHFNRAYYGNNEKECIRRLLFMTEKFWNQLVVFARRPEHRMERYAKKIEPMEITEYMRRADKSGSHEFHYYAVNLANRDTIEFRMFRGSLNVNTVLATLQLVNNIVVASKEKTLEEIKSMKFEDLLTTRVQRAYWKRHSALPDTEE